MGIMNRSGVRSKRGMEAVVRVLLIVAAVMIVLGIILVFFDVYFPRPPSEYRYQRQAQENLRQMVLDELRSGQKLFSFPQSEIRVSSKGETYSVFGIRNNESVNAQFCIFFSKTKYTGSVGTLNLISDDSVQDLEPTQDVVIPFSIEAGTAQKGRYKLMITIIKLDPLIQSEDCSSYPSQIDNLFNVSMLLPGDSIYAQKSFYITVN